MQYVPNESANAALAITVNILDVLVEKGILAEDERINVLQHAISDVPGNTISNIEARRVIGEIAHQRYGKLFPQR